MMQFQIIPEVTVVKQRYGMVRLFTLIEIANNLFAVCALLNVL